MAKRTPVVIPPRELAPLADFPIEMRNRIEQLSQAKKCPPRYIELCVEHGRPLVLMPSRAWWEWHIRRNINPDAVRVNLPPSLRRAVIERDGRQCGICGKEIVADESIDIDHIKPFSLGGTDTLDNLQVAHARCNRSKGAKYEGDLL